VERKESRHCSKSMLQNPADGIRKAIKKFLPVAGRKFEMEKLDSKSKRRNTEE
jgi:hypothetical protein